MPKGSLKWRPGSRRPDELAEPEDDAHLVRGDLVEGTGQDDQDDDPDDDVRRGHSWESWEAWESSACSHCEGIGLLDPCGSPFLIPRSLHHTVKAGEKLMARCPDRRSNRSRAGRTEVSILGDPEVDATRSRSSRVFSPHPVMTRTDRARGGNRAPAGHSQKRGQDSGRGRVAEDSFVFGQEALGPEDFGFADGRHRARRSRPAAEGRSSLRADWGWRWRGRSSGDSGTGAIVVRPRSKARAIGAQPRGLDADEPGDLPAIIRLASGPGKPRMRPMRWPPALTGTKTNSGACPPSCSKIS